MQVEHIKIDGDRLIAEVKRLVAEGKRPPDQHQARGAHGG